MEIHLNDISDINGRFFIRGESLSGLYFTANNILFNGNILHFIFDSTVFKIDTAPRNKVFLKLTENYLEKYNLLINKIQSDINVSVNDYDTVFRGKNVYLTPRIIGGTVNNKTNIFTKFYKIVNGKPVKITVNEVPQQFKGLFTIKVRSVVTSNTDTDKPKYLILELSEILITDILKNTVKNNKYPSSYKYLNYNNTVK